MDEKTTLRLQWWMTLLGGPIAMNCMGICWYIMGHNYQYDLHPPGQGLSAYEIAINYYAANSFDITLGMSLAAIFAVWYMVWSIQLSCMMWRREKLPLLSLTQLVGGVATGWLMASSFALWAWCGRWAGTPGIENEFIKSVHTLTWYYFDLTYWITTIQCVAMGLFAILDKKKPSMFPVWLGWLSIFAGLTFIPVTFIAFNDEGIFSYQGYWNFHFIFLLWVFWYFVTNYYMFKDIKRARTSPTIGIGQAISN